MRTHRKQIALFLFLLSCIACIGFVVFSVFIKKDHSAVARFDFDTTVRVQNHVALRWDNLLSLLSMLGSFEVIFIILVIVLILRRSLAAIVSIALFGFGHIVEIFGKTFVNHPGPPFLFHRTHLPFYLPSGYVNPGSSYPSGHSFRTIFLLLIIAGIVWLNRSTSWVTRIIVSLFCIGFSALMVFTRVSLGEHWTSDVVGGALLGLWLGSFSLIFFLRRAKQAKKQQ